MGVTDISTKLTGNYHHKKVLFAGLVLFVEVEETKVVEYSSPNGRCTERYRTYHYKKAKEEDVYILQITYKKLL